MGTQKSTGEKTADLLARIVRASNPTEAPPTAATLVSWVNSGACPTDALTDAAMLLTPLMDELSPLTMLEQFVNTKGPGGTIRIALSRLDLRECENLFLTIKIALTVAPQRSPAVEFSLHGAPRRCR